jgi:putative ABC transport system permease protein
MRHPLRWLAREAGLRFLARRKAACGVAIITMMLALGANTTVFSVVHTFLRASLAIPDPDRVALIAPVRNLPGRGTVVFAEAFPNYEIIRRAQHAFADLTIMSQNVASWDDHGESRPLQLSRVTASFFPTMRVYPIIGRAFSEREEGHSPARVVVLSHALWRSAFGAEPGVIGKTMRVNGEPHIVIGVMPPGFSQPVPTDIWLPFDIPAVQRTAITGARNLTVYGRLAPGQTLESARADAERLTARALEASPADNRAYRYEVRPLRAVLLDGADSTMLLVQGGALILLLLATLNLASLLLAWGFERRLELAVRQALGAGTARLVRILLLQSLFVVGFGASLGVLVSWLVVHRLQHLNLNPTINFFTTRIDLDSGVLATTAVVAMIAGLAAGVLPAWFTRHIHLAHDLRAGSRSATLSPTALRCQKAMVFVQAGLSVVILAAATLVGVSFHRLSRVPIGFAPRNLVVARVQLLADDYAKPPNRVRFGRDLLENLAREPAVAAAAFTSTLPVGDQLWGGRFFVELPGGGFNPEPMLLHLRRVSPNYLQSIGIPVQQGRQMDAHDDTTGPAVAIVSRALAERLWPGETAVGKRLYRVTVAGAEPEPLAIIGVTGNTMDAGSGVPPGETVYVPWAQVSTSRMSIIIVPRSGEDAAVAALKRALRATDPGVAASDVARLEALVDQANALPQLRTVLLLAFAIVALAMVALGSYGVMSQLVSAREREYALRLVFGAAPRLLGRSVLVQMARLTIPGVIVGSLAVLLLGGALRTFVFGIEPRSIGVLSGVSAGILVITLAATLPSVIRVMRLDVRRSVTGQ